MSRDSLSTEDASAQEHAKVAGGSKQGHGTEEEDHSDRNSRFWRDCAGYQSYDMDHDENSHHQGKQKRSPIENIRFASSPPRRQPRGCHQITRE